MEYIYRSDSAVEQSCRPLLRLHYDRFWRSVSALGRRPRSVSVRSLSSTVLGGRIGEIFTTIGVLERTILGPPNISLGSSLLLVTSSSASVVQILTSLNHRSYSQSPHLQSPSTSPLRLPSIPPRIPSTFPRPDSLPLSLLATSTPSTPSEKCRLLDNERRCTLQRDQAFPRSRLFSVVRCVVSPRRTVADRLRQVS